MDKPLVLWGGTDVDSYYYDEPRSKWAQLPDIHRDTKEFNAVNKAVKDGQPIVGVCRGAQLLCIANGGKLYQHSQPSVQCHDIMTKTGILIENVAADHHQIMIPMGNYIKLAYNPYKVGIYFDNNKFDFVEKTPEVVWFPDTRCLAIQPHPEWMDSTHPFNVWLNELMKELEIEYEF